MMQIPFVNLAAQHEPLREQLLLAVNDVLQSGQFILSEVVQRFEQQFAALCGVKYAVGVNSGTDALVLALRVLEIGPGDEVITVPNSFVATASSIMLVGATPVFVDVGEDFNIDPAKIAAAISSRTRAILPVHLTGRPAQMQEITAIAGKCGLHVIEDAAQAFLAARNGRRAGSFGVLGCFSLHPLKTLNACGDAGIVTTNDADLYEKLKILRNLGLQNRDTWVACGPNSRLDAVQAAMLLVKLEYVQDWTRRRRDNARFYQEALADVPEVRFQRDPAGVHSVFHTFVIEAERRDALQKFLAEKGIGTAIHYPAPIHLQPAAAGLGYAPGDLPVAEQQAQRILSLPVYPELTVEQLQYIVDSIRAFYR